MRPVSGHMKPVEMPGMVIAAQRGDSRGGKSWNGERVQRGVMVAAKIALSMDSMAQFTPLIMRWARSIHFLAPEEGMPCLAIFPL